MNQDATINLLLLGAGRWARNYVRTIEGLPDVRLACIARNRNEAPDFLPAGCRFTIDWRGAVTDPGMDGVIIATPPGTHAEMAEFAMRSRKPVLIEKPLTLNLREAESLLATATEFKSIVLVEHTHLFNPGYRALKTHIAEIGPVCAIHAAAGAHGPFRRETPMLWDWGAHDLALIVDLLGASPSRVVACRARAEQTPEGTGESCVIELEMPGGVPVRIEISNILRDKTRRFTVYGRSGILRFDDWSQDKVRIFPAGEAFSEPSGGRAIIVEARMPLAVAVAEFVAAIRKGAQDIGSLRLGVDVIRVLDECERIRT